ncbi:MAG: HAMP domain-containing sensor histidine kinase [Pirellulaceae bacterium]
MAGLRPSQLDERLNLRGTGDELDRLSGTFNRLLDRIGNYLQNTVIFSPMQPMNCTPLAAIRSSIEVALNKPRSATEYEALLTDVIEESASLELLVNQLLLLAETEAERLRVHSQPVRLDELVEKAMEMFGGVAEYRDIHLHCPPLPAVEVSGNPQHLRQVIYNLLDNALKFTRVGGSVNVELLVADAMAVFTVRDTGPGILAADLPFVFDRFFQGKRRTDGQVPNTTKEVKGTGLGLSICQAIVRSHQGSIHVASVLDQETCFTVKLPLATT